MLLFFISSGLFLGWALGANDAANVFGTAVGTRMIRFRYAAVISGLFVIFGAVVQGSGTTETLTNLGNVNALAGSFTVALATALTVFFMTRYAIPVSTSQAIIGGIVGWNFYTGVQTNYDSLIRIVLTWVASPILGAIFAIILFLLLRNTINRVRIHILNLNAGIRIALILVGAFGAFSLGANNIANVMGVFVPAVDLDQVHLLGYSFSSEQQLFFLGGLAIAFGIFTYSKRIMERVGNHIFRLSAEAAIVVVLAHALVLFVFSSKSLQQAIVGLGLPAIPLVPVSSSQAIVGAVMGIGILKGARGLNFKVLGQIGLGWIITPIVTAIIAFFALFFVNNVFEQKVSQSEATESLSVKNLNIENPSQTKYIICPKK
mgnify:FL=1